MKERMALRDVSKPSSSLPSVDSSMMVGLSLVY
jgi:hypothetical protein